jgi:hypothetical protein
MRRAALAALALLLAACANPTGAERPGCGPDRRDAELVVTRAGGTDARPIPIDCMHQLSSRRLRVGFTMPAGPACHHFDHVEIVESADAVAITLYVAVNEDPNAGACADAPRVVVTEIDLAAPVDDRVLLDGSAG